MRALTIVCCLIAVAACSRTSPVSPTPVDRRIVLAPGQSTFVSEARLTIRFDTVTGDSRCPADAMCVWAGDAVVRVQISPASGGTLIYELHTSDTRPLTFDDLTVTMVELAPYPFTAHPIHPDDYRVTLRVTR